MKIEITRTSHMTGLEEGPPYPNVIYDSENDVWTLDFTNAEDFMAWIQRHIQEDVSPIILGKAIGSGNLEIEIYDDYRE